MMTDPMNFYLDLCSGLRLSARSVRIFFVSFCMISKDEGICKPSTTLEHLTSTGFMLYCGGATI